MQIKTNKHHLAKIIKGHTIGFQTLLTHVFFDNISIIYLSGEFLPQIEVADEAIYPIIMFLKKHTLCLYEIMIDSTAYELLSHIYRFILSFNLLSLKYNTRILIKSKVKELNTNILSLTSIFFNSFWIEREVYDFYGIRFAFNKDLRRLLLDYGFSGYPLRKDFPLTGFLEVIYDDSFKKIVYDPIELAQEYRNFFHYKSPN